MRKLNLEIQDETLDFKSAEKMADSKAETELGDCIRLGWYNDELENADIMSQDKDPKTKLQEFMQALVRPIPAYEVEKTEGQEHDQVFTVSCKVKGLKFKTNGKGKTRKKAEQNAAKAFLEKLQTKEKI